MNKTYVTYLFESFKFGANQYLRETTVHGLRYLVEGRNVLEKAAWSIVIAFCFVMALFGIYSSVKGSYDDPILTSIKTTQIQKVGIEEFSNYIEIQIIRALF